MKRRIYTDTSVIGGCRDEEFKEHSLRLFDRFRERLDIIVLSSITESELERAPTAVRKILADLPPDIMEEVQFTEEASSLAGYYIEAGVVGRAKLADAQHIATATVHRVDVLVSWNFRHIVRLDRIHGYNSVNLRQGYPLLEIRTPREVACYGDAEQELRRCADDACDSRQDEPGHEGDDL